MPKIRLIQEKGEYRWNDQIYLAGNLYDVSEAIANYLISECKVARLDDSEQPYLATTAFVSKNNVKTATKVETKIDEVSIPSQPVPSSPKWKIAMIRIGGMGDSLILAGFAAAVKRKYPNSDITLFVRDRLGYDIASINPNVSQTVIAGNSVWKELLNKVLLGDYDIVYDNRYATKVYYNKPSLWEKDKLVTDKAFSKYNEFYNTFPLSNNKLSNAISFSERELFYRTTCLPGSDNDLYVPLVMEDYKFHPFLEGCKYVTVHNGSDVARQTKCWETAKWAQVVRYLHDKGYKVIQLGGSHEERIDGAINLTGKTSVTQAAAIMSSASFHIDTESGMVHLARAVKTRSIVLFGPTPIHFFGYKENINISTPFKCKEKWWINDMWWRECPEKYPLPPKCMTAITPKIVFTAIEEIEKMKEIQGKFAFDPQDVNEKFAIELPLGESHYKSEPWQWDRIYTMMSLVKGPAILEVGAGDGYCVEVLTKQGYDVTGVEISHIRLKRMQERGIKAIWGDIHQLPFPDQSFDTVMCGEVLEHIPSMSKGLAELERVCKKDGKIIISLPVGEDHRGTKMHLWGIRNHPILRMGKEDMLVMELERINGNELTQEE